MLFIIFARSKTFKLKSSKLLPHLSTNLLRTYELRKRP